MTLRSLQVMESQEESKAEAAGGAPFPSARYFQIRFEYLHEVLAELKQQLDEANLQIRALQARLETLDAVSAAETTELTGQRCWDTGSPLP